MSDYAGRTFEFIPKSELSPVKIQVEELLKTYCIIHSYSRKGNPADNSPIEAFHSVIKCEYVHRQLFKNYD